MIESLQFALVITCGLLVAVILALVSFIRHLLRDRRELTASFIERQRGLERDLRLAAGAVQSLLVYRLEDNLRFGNHIRDFDGLKQKVESELARILPPKPEPQRIETKIVDGQFKADDQPQGRQQRQQNGRHRNA